MVILGVDYGDTRTGLSFCDKLEMLASPLCVIEEGYAPKLAKIIADRAELIKAERIVMGMPRNMDGSYGFRAEKCREFAKLLESESNLQVEFEDERLTTVMAHEILHSNNRKEQNHKTNVDAVSAVIILQSYLDRQK